MDCGTDYAGKTRRERHHSPSTVFRQAALGTLDDLINARNLFPVCDQVLRVEGPRFLAALVMAAAAANTRALQISACQPSHQLTVSVTNRIGLRVSQVPVTMEAKATSPTAAWGGRAIWQGQFAERPLDTFRSNKHDVKNPNLPAGKPCSIVGSLLDRKGLQFKGCWTRPNNPFSPCTEGPGPALQSRPALSIAKLSGSGWTGPFGNVTDTTRKEGTFHLPSQTDV